MSGSIRGDGLEVERTFLLRGMPVLPPSATAWQIEQGYLHGNAEIEGRVRRETGPNGTAVCTHTIKHGTGLVRKEQERALEGSEFERLWAQTEGRRLRKIRHKVVEGAVVWEIDEFIGLPQIEGRSLVMAEVEIPAEMEANEIVLPAWLTPVVIREVTEEPQFRNYSLATASATI